MGADRGIHVEITGKDYDSLQPFHVSKLLAKVADEEKVDMVFVGKQVINALMYITQVNKLAGFLGC